MGFSYASLLPVIIICLIFVALIIYKVYSNIYKKKINKKLEANESMAHVSMLPSESIGKVLVIIGLSIFTFSTISMLSDISSELHNNQNNINNTIINLQYEITDLKNQLKEQNSVFSEFDYEYGKVDTTNHTVDITFRCIPKTTGADTSVSITMGNENINLKKTADGRYTGTKAFPLFEPNCGNIFASITTNGITTTHVVSENEHIPLYQNFMPQLHGTMLIDNEKQKNNKYNITGTYLNDAKGDINNVKLIFCVNGKEIERIDISEYSTSIDKTFDSGKNDQFDIYAEGTDEYGYTHKQLILSIYDDEEPDYKLGNYTVSDKNGNILYEE